MSDCFRGKLANSPYFGEYAANPPWHARLAEFEGELVVLVTQDGEEGPHALSVVRIESDADRTLVIRDYYACPWILGPAFTEAAHMPSLVGDVA